MAQTTRRRGSLLLALLVGLTGLARANPQQLVPQDLDMRVWTKQQGLPDDSVNALLQSRDGYLWIGTAGGLARFDGIRFVPILPPPTASGLPMNVTALCEDAAGLLWVGTQGTGLWNYHNGTLSRFYGHGVRLDKTITSIAEDTYSNLWVGTPAGLFRVTGDRVVAYTPADGLPNEYISSVHVARSGMVWITTRGGICQFKNGSIKLFPFQTESPGRSPESLGVYEDRRGNLWAFGDTYLVNLTEGKHLNHFGGGHPTSSLRIWSLCEGQNGELWIGTSGNGLYCFADDKFVPLTLRNGGLSSDVRALCEDQEGNLWLGTHGSGLVRLWPRNVSLSDPSLKLPNRPVTCLTFSATGQAWVGYERGSLYAGGSDNFEKLSFPAAAELQNLIASVAVTADSNLWVATAGMGLYRVRDHQVQRFTTADGLSDNRVLALAAANGAVWAGTAAGGLHCFTNNHMMSFGPGGIFPREPVTALLPARNGGLWTGFGNGQIFRQDTNGFHAVSIPPEALGRAIRSLYETKDGQLWLGTAGGILACVTPDTWFHWELNPGSPDDPITGILGDDDGDLWFSTSTAIYRVTQKDLTVLLSSRGPLRPQVVFKADATTGFSPSYGWPRAAQSPDGKFWFGLDAGMVLLDLYSPVGDVAPPPVLIEQVTVNGEPLESFSVPRSDTGTNAPLFFPSDQDSLEIKYTALSFSTPEKLHFRYRIDGYDSDWVDAGKERSVHYGRLPYGNYTFRVQAGPGDGTWYNKEAQFGFFIPTPLWRTPAALLLYAVTAVLGVAITVRLVSNRRLRRRVAILAAQQAMERERMRIAQDMHDEIGSKLTKISFMSERAKGELRGQEPVARKLDSIAHTSRDLLKSLDEIVWAVKPNNDTLEHLAAYLGQYVTEYFQNTPVECDLRIARGLPHYPLSAEIRHNLFLAFEEALNNALKHGRPALVQVTMGLAGNRFEIKVEDNGCGFDPAALALAAAAAGPAAPTKRGGNGLLNIRQRLADVGGQCFIRSQPGKGTTVILSIVLEAVRTPGRRR